MTSAGRTSNLKQKHGAKGSEIAPRRSTITEKVRQLRKNRGLTQAEFSKVIGLSQSRLSEIEGGQGSLLESVRYVNPF